ncbi:Intradiol ring-cleavage dioxygenase core [Penicillium cf. griseofulvum]|uniref:Intradiol ring-cleavage dioxygenase core n=1 Tax=Penicillium cf. griseofulvum TaxID=2972120 RepID=A0A9W9J5G6_9EURO|nr:Intradiol ring-cleavage dioxygenase core [Penicillium cf. griseofulvum]KAJ5427515.1 Intradiol ring-cleavage dioxygenase core [Penicillium cf. griseofulvum]
MVQLSKFLAIAAACLAGPAIAHPGEKHDPHVVKREIHTRDAVAAHAKLSLRGCESTLHARELNKRSIARRSSTVKKLRQKRGITAASQKWRRDLAALEKWEAIDHNRTDVLDYSPATPESVVFGASTSFVLSPTITDGPYYVWGEVVRQNVKEELYSDGVDVFLEVQYIDVNTCKPVPGAVVDIWQANATGVYSGISMSGNYAAGGWDSTYLRGIQQTDRDGVATFESIIPGHYEGRATHTHLLTHLNATLLPNKTLKADTGSVAHIGQLFWNEVLRTAVEDTYPYNTNTQDITSNAEDMWSIEQADSAYDPFPEYIYLGEGLDDGLFAWIQIGINTTADYTDDSYYSIAGFHGADGGYQNSDSSFGGGSGGPAGASGSPPSGTGSVVPAPSSSVSA